MFKYHISSGTVFEPNHSKGAGITGLPQMNLPTAAELQGIIYESRIF